MTTRFLVEVGYRDFVFDDPQKAMDFALNAKTHYRKDDSDRSCDVVIKFIDEDKED